MVSYTEPFAGSLATVLGRPGWPWEGVRTETVNDADCYIANFWRALAAGPEAVAEHADWPINEADLRARHIWLLSTGADRIEKIKSDPDYFDAKVAGWWVWGISQWIGAGWCTTPAAAAWAARPHLTSESGVHKVYNKRPHLSASMGVHRKRIVQKMPRNEPAGITTATVGDLYEYFDALAARLRRVRVCCGDWSRVCGSSLTNRNHITAVFLDPPYADTAKRDDNLYGVDSLTVAHDVRKWAIENGEHPRLRIALCGYEGEHVMPSNWECVKWKAQGGYGNQGDDNENEHKERIWFSPYCLKGLRTSVGFDL